MEKPLNEMSTLELSTMFVKECENYLKMLAEREEQEIFKKKVFIAIGKPWK